MLMMVMLDEWMMMMMMLMMMRMGKMAMTMIAMTRATCMLRDGHRCLILILQLCGSSWHMMSKAFAVTTCLGL